MEDQDGTTMNHKPTRDIILKTIFVLRSAQYFLGQLSLSFRLFLP